MRKRYGIVILTLLILLTATVVSAQPQSGKFGIGVTISDSAAGIIFSLASSHFMLEPTFSMQLSNQDSQNRRFFFPGIGLLYQFHPQSDLRPVVGVRFGLNILRTYVTIPYYYDPPYTYYLSERDTYVDVIVGPVFGARYYLSDNFAVSGEFKMMATFYDKGDIRGYHRNTYDLSVATSQFMAVYFYF